MSPVDFVLLGASVFAALYWLGALICVDLFARRRVTPPRSSPPVSVLKPLRGADGHLHENLRSFCDQDYPRFEVLFGVQSLDDPAVAVVDRLIREFPHLELRLVVDDRAIGTNGKASNLASLVRQAKHDTIILADGDMRVDPAYIRAVVAPLEERTVGLVTCLFVRWHDERFRVRRDGRLERLAGRRIDGHPSHPAGSAPIAPKPEEPA